MQDGAAPLMPQIQAVPNCHLAAAARKKSVGKYMKILKMWCAPIESHLGP